MAADSSFVNYAGNAGLGSGSSAGIPVTSDKGLDGVNDLGRQLLQMDASRNFNIYQQKLKDQDALYQMLDQDKIDPGPILAEDRKIVDDGNNLVSQAWDYMNKNGGRRNIDAMRKYNETVQEAKNRATQARVRYISAKQQEQEIAGAKIDKERAARTDNYNGWKNGDFWGNVKQFQPQNSIDFQGMREAFLDKARIGEDNQVLVKGATPTSNTSQKGGPLSAKPVLSEFTYVPGSRLSYDQIVRNATANFGSNPQRTQDVQKIYDLATTANPQDFSKLVGSLNSRLQEYNTMFGLEPGEKDYAAPITQTDVVVDEQGRPHFNSSSPELAAKIVLGMENDFGNKGGFQFNKDQADLKENKRKNLENEAIDWAKIKIDKDKANLDVKKFMESTQGPIKLKNASLVYAANTIKTLQDAASLKTKEADGTISQWVLTPEDIRRKLTQRELVALGKAISTTEKKEDGTTTTTTKTKIDPLSIEEGSILVVGNDGTVRVLKNAYDTGTKKYNHNARGYIEGTFDENKGTNIQQIALNNYQSIIESGQGQEINGFAGIIDPTGAGTQVDESGGGTKRSGTSVSSQKQGGTQRPYAPAGTSGWKSRAKVIQ